MRQVSRRLEVRNINDTISTHGCVLAFVLELLHVPWARTEIAELNRYENTKRLCISYQIRKIGRKICPHVSNPGVKITLSSFSKGLGPPLRMGFNRLFQVSETKRNSDRKCDVDRDSVNVGCSVVNLLKVTSLNSPPQRFPQNPSVLCHWHTRKRPLPPLPRPCTSRFNHPRHCPLFSPRVCPPALPPPLPHILPLFPPPLRFFLHGHAGRKQDDLEIKKLQKTR